MTDLQTRAGVAGLFKFGVAAVAAVALTFTGMSAASAAEVQLGPESIAGYENGTEGDTGYNYDTWHIGNTYDTAQVATNSLQFNTCSITGLTPVEGRDVTQVLKGFPIDGRPTGVANIQSMIDSLSVEVVGGSVTLQLPFFFWFEGNPDPGFTTFRNAEPFTTAGTFSLTADTAMLDSDGYDAGTLGELLTEMAAAEADGGITFELLGTGFTLGEGSEVSALNFGGNEYLFGTGNCLTPVVPAKPKAPTAVDTGL